MRISTIRSLFDINISLQETCLPHEINIVQLKHIKSYISKFKEYHVYGGQDELFFKMEDLMYILRTYKKDINIIVTMQQLLDLHHMKLAKKPARK